MIQMTLAEATTIIEASANQDLKDKCFSGISIDTRTLLPGNLFVAIKGEHFDGHDYIEEAHQKGALAAIVSHDIHSSLPQLKVKQTAIALGQLASAWRNQFTIPLLAITGSNGKTTLKNMIATILLVACQQDESKILASLRSFNNAYGLPMTLSALNSNHRYAVIEMGMNHFGEIEYLTKLARPTVAIITNAAAAHLEGVGNVLGVARAKSEIFIGLSEEGVAILNRDDAFYTFWREQIGTRRSLTFGFHPDADVSLLQVESAQKQQIILHTPEGNIDLHLPLLGKHNILNALAASAAALALGISPTHIKAGLEKVSPAPGRLQLHTLLNGVNIIDDTYNANPFSLQAAVDTLALFTGKKILVLGDMKELGGEAKQLHQTAGEKIRQAGIDFLFTYGELSAHAAQAFGEGAYHFNEQEKLIQALKPLLYNQTTILVKGSRSMRMEKVVVHLLQ